MSSYDVAIIGGGLAGLSLAIQLGRQGLKVVLFEKNQYPFHKVCGEYIAMESWDFLENLGIRLSEMQLPRIRRLQISSPAGHLIEQPLTPGGFGISRYMLDGQLAELARQAGVRLLEKTSVKALEPLSADKTRLQTSQGEFEARLVCGSYGKYANLDLRLGRRFIAPQTRASAFAAIKYHVELELADDLIALHNFEGGYCGMSRIEDGRSCLCYLVRASRLKAAGSIEALEQKLLMRNPHLRQVFQQARSLYQQPLAITQIHFQPKSAVEQGLLMLGDAAGLIPPLCGNGMSMALHASSLLAPLIEDFFEQKLTREQLEQHYSTLWKTSFARRLKAGRFLQHLFGRSLPVSLFLRGIEPFPALMQGLIGLTHGKPF